MLTAEDAWPDANTRLRVDATPAIVQIKPLSEGRKLIRLPALEFQFTVQALCAADSRAQSISISIADTRKTIGSDDMTGVSETPIIFSVPARQLSPVAVRGFCPQADDGNGPDELLIRDAVTAHLSLRCAGEDGDGIVYRSLALDVMLQCDPGNGNQGESAAEVTR